MIYQTIKFLLDDHRKEIDADEFGDSSSIYIEREIEENCFGFGTWLSSQLIKLPLAL